MIKDDALQSKPWWAPRVVPPKGAPNVLLIITDDAGFGVPSTFGGVISTPTMDRIASEGLRDASATSTALCSPTRAALITGRNHHSAGFGVVSEQSTGFPGYNSIIDRDKATIGRVLLENGYATSWFGRDDNTPAFAASQVGPFDQWPTGMGFEVLLRLRRRRRQWSAAAEPLPQHHADSSVRRQRTGHLEFDHCDGRRRHRLHDADPPDRSEQADLHQELPGATHAPHHPTKEWVDKISAMKLFDDGYEKLRERIFENQSVGAIPKDAKLTPWPKDVLKPWDERTPRQRKALYPPGRGVRRLWRV